MKGGSGYRSVNQSGRPAGVWRHEPAGLSTPFPLPVMLLSCRNLHVSTCNQPQHVSA